MNNRSFSKIDNPQRPNLMSKKKPRTALTDQSQSVDKFTIFTDFTVISLRFIPAFIGGDE